MARKELVIDFDKDGNASIEVFGAKGKDCLSLTKDIEEALGSVTKRDEKPEMKQREEREQLRLRQ
jgi:hypothetical protein